MSRYVILACVASFCADATTAKAQAARISGTVRDSASAAPLVGAVVSLLDAGKLPVGRVITNAAGQYSLVLAPGGAELRVVRIGFSPRTIPLVARDGNVVMDVRMHHIPTLLSGMSVNDDRVCSADRNRAEALSLWEQARAGLLASVVARETQPARSTIYSYERTTDLDLNRVARQTAHSASGKTTRPFIAASEPGVLAERGYSEMDAAGSMVFKSPDADVLLDESFAHTHCFSVQQPDGDHVGQIGLSFEPAHGRGQLTDVRGTLWLDATAPALRTLEFRYTGPNPVLTHERTVGRIQFRAMPNGVVFIDEWYVRLPILRQERGQRSYSSTGGINRDIRSDAGDVATRAIQVSETGGLVLSAAWPDGLHYETPLQPFTGVVAEAGSTTPLPGTLVFLEGTADSVLTDSVGRFAFFPVLPGRYELKAADTTLFEFARTRTMDRVVDVTGGAMVPVRLELMGRMAALKQYCPVGDITPSTSIVVGRLTGRDASSKDLGNVRVAASWWKLPTQEIPEIAVLSDKQSASVDDEGRFAFCGVGRGRTVHLLSSHLGVQFSDTLLEHKNAEIVTVSWPVNFDSLLRLKPVPPARLVGQVRRAGAAVAGADVWALSYDRHATTDSAGRFSFDSLPSGTVLLQVRRLGYAAVRDTITLSSGLQSTRTFTFSETATQLDTNRTIASGVKYISPALRGFEDRRATSGSGYFIPDSVLRAHDIDNLATILTSRVGGLALRSGAMGAGYMITTRQPCVGTGLRGCKPCYATVYIDGVLTYSATFDQLHQPPPPDATRLHASDFAGIEWYPDESMVPPQFHPPDTGCGVVLLWTRER